MILVHRKKKAVEVNTNYNCAICQVRRLLYNFCLLNPMEMDSPQARDECGLVMYSGAAVR